MPQLKGREFTPADLHNLQCRLKRSSRFYKTALTLAPSLLPIAVLCIVGWGMGVSAQVLTNILLYSTATVGLLICVGCCVNLTNYLADIEKIRKEKESSWSTLTKELFAAHVGFEHNRLKRHILSSVISFLVWVVVLTIALQKMAGHLPLPSDSLQWLLSSYNLGIAGLKLWFTSGLSPPVILEKIHE